MMKTGMFQGIADVLVGGLDAVDVGLDVVGAVQAKMVESDRMTVEKK